MAASGIPHFHNDVGVATIHVGSREFMCIGAKPPFDHPHIYIDMGGDDETICEYCGTHYKHDPALAPGDARPSECVWLDSQQAA